VTKSISRLALLALTLLAAYTLAGCQDEPVELPTRVAVLPTLTATAASPAAQQPAAQQPAATVPPTWTVAGGGPPPSPTPGNRPTFTPRPSNTPFTPFTPTSTATPVPSETPVLPPTLTPSPTAPPLGTENLLPNPSFEDGWYNQNGTPELQLPNSWQLQWDEGFNWLDSDPWNRFVRPETRVLASDLLPANERDLFIWDGNQTVKIFKREGALSFRLTTLVSLEPGSYLFTIQVFPDMVDDYTEAGGKIWAPDPLSAQLRFIMDPPSNEWHFPTFGQKNEFQYAFYVSELKTVRIGVHFVGRWAILNNGWFMDDWSLIQLSPET
jgi:hypothetical protein